MSKALWILASVVFFQHSDWLDTSCWILFFLPYSVSWRAAFQLVCQQCILQQGFTCWYANCLDEMFYHLCSTPKWWERLLSCQRNFACKIEDSFQVRRFDKVPAWLYNFFWILNFLEQSSTNSYSMLDKCHNELKGIGARGSVNFGVSLKGLIQLTSTITKDSSFKIILNVLVKTLIYSLITFLFFIEHETVSASLVTHGCLQKASGSVSELYSSFPMVCACWLGISWVFGEVSDFKFPHQGAVYF